MPRQRKALTQGSWMEPLGFFSSTLQKEKNSRTCSSVELQRRNTDKEDDVHVPEQSPSLQHQGHNKTLLVALKSGARDCSIKLLIHRIHRDCAVSFLEGKFEQIKVRFYQTNWWRWEQPAKPWGLEDTCVRHFVFKAWGFFFPLPILILISDRLYSSDIIYIYIYIHTDVFRFCCCCFFWDLFPQRAAGQTLEGVMPEDSFNSLAFQGTF